METIKELEKKIDTKKLIREALKEIKIEWY